MKLRVFYNPDCQMYGVQELRTDYMGTRYVQILPPRGKGARNGKSAYTPYRGVAKRWIKELHTQGGMA